MTPNETWNDLARYLAAKKTVDDRALNRLVLETARRNLPSAPPLRVIELGAGIGTMLTRLLEWGFLPAEVEYTAVDAAPALAAHAVAHLREWARSHNYAFSVEESGYTLQSAEQSVKIRWQTADAVEFAARAAPVYHLLVAHAFLDLVHLPTALPTFLRLIPNGVFLFTLNFDGVTVFEPPAEGDDVVLAHYHRTMDERLTEGGAPAGESKTGRRLLSLLPSLGARILAAGSSDWVVFPQNGAYPHAEAEFLQTILNFVEGSLRGREGLDTSLLKRWMARRRAQVEAGELIYIAHQLDVAGLVR